MTHFSFNQVLSPQSWCLIAHVAGCLELSLVDLQMCENPALCHCKSAVRTNLCDTRQEHFNTPVISLRVSSVSRCTIVGGSASVRTHWTSRCTSQVKGCCSSAPDKGTLLPSSLPPHDESTLLPLCLSLPLSSVPPWSAVHWGACQKACQMKSKKGKQARVL